MSFVRARLLGLHAGLLPAALLALCLAAQERDGGRAFTVSHAQTTIQQTVIAADSGCILCHSGIEDMHPAARLSCTECHGGDGQARSKLEAHVPKSGTARDDERVAPQDEDLAWRRFQNPMDLRVAQVTCGGCHEDITKHVLTSLHASTAGHLSDGFVEFGLQAEKKSRYSVFPMPSHLAEPGDVSELFGIPPFLDEGPRNELSTHYSDLPRKECMQCHLWSEGRAVRGRVGFDGDYRGEGCAACHVPYARDGRSQSTDRSVDKAEPGHPKQHALTRAPATDTCVSCHYGDASIGLHFQGLSQLPPGAPGGPEIAGTTKELRNLVFYLNDPALCPPDVHYERGMHCIDCHTAGDLMGNGQLWGAMEHAVEISCQDCHGTFTNEAALRTQRGTPLAHVVRRGEKVVLTSKVTGREHVVPQALQVLDPLRAEHNPHAVKAMNSAHAKLECYTCHAGWNVNFLGFHFDRNESLSQLDLISGARTPGRVTTQEKVFATWKSFFAGWNEAGRIAPYLTGFSSMGTLRGPDGELLLDQVMPVTKAGLSGMTMIHHQLHSTRPTARSCVECHRSSATWGLGSPNFRLSRKRAFVADRRGIEVVAWNRAQPAACVPLSKFVLPDVVDLALECEPLQGSAVRLFAAEGGRGIHVLDASDPTRLSRLGFVASVGPQGLALGGDVLYVADGPGGVRLLDISPRGQPQLLAHVPTFDARAVTVQWPYAYVADGPAGLLVLDVRDPRQPKIAGGSRLSVDPTLDDAAVDVAVLFQYSRPLAKDTRPLDRRSDARLLCAVLDAREGLVLLDVTEPAAPKLLVPSPDVRPRSRARESVTYRSLALHSHVDLAETQGGSRTRENDFAYVLRERELDNGQRTSTLAVIEVTRPDRPRGVGEIGVGDATEMVLPVAVYNPPFLQRLFLVPGEEGVLVSDATISAEPKQVGVLGGIGQAYVVAIEEFPLDRMLDEQGQALKDVSHAKSRWLNLPEIGRILDVPGSVLGTRGSKSVAPTWPGHTARLAFVEQDKDRSGTLAGEELALAPFAEDLDRDGRVLLADLGAMAGLLRAKRTQTIAASPASGVVRRTRVDPDGDLARLLDGIDPHAFDEDGDGLLRRAECTKAFLAALDLDGSKNLSMDEFSRAPGAWAGLRFQDVPARKLFASVDTNSDGELSPREFSLSDEDWAALDTNADKSVRILDHYSEDPRSGEFSQAKAEWPWRRAAISGLAPAATAEQVLELLDRDRDGVLSAKELRRRKDLASELDQDQDSSVSSKELRERIDAVAGQGVEILADDFLARWDQDGSGAVEAPELPPVARWLLPRGS